MEVSQMDSSAKNKDLIRDHVITIILKSLEIEDKYGYEICREIETKTDGAYILKQPTLYSCLKRLEAQNYITSYMGEVSNGGKRRYYSLTQLGRDFLEYDQREWEYSRTLINRLLSNKDYDLTTPGPFNANDLRPYTRRATSFIKDMESDVQENVETISHTTDTSTPDDAIETKPTLIEEPDAQIKVDINDNTDNIVEDNQSTDNIQEYTYTQYVEYSPSVDNYQVDDNTPPEIAPTDASEDIPAPATTPYGFDTNDDLNYKSVFDSLVADSMSNTKPSIEESITTPNNQYDKSYNYSELSQYLYTKGYKLRCYTKSNSNTYYNMNFFYSNRLSVLHSILLFVIMLAEIVLVNTTLGSYISEPIDTYLYAVLVAAIFPVISIARFAINPNRKQKADIDVKSTIINRMLIFINLSLVITAIGFLLFGVNFFDFNTLVLPVLIPVIIVANIPLSKILYLIIYKTKAYHIK